MREKKVAVRMLASHELIGAIRKRLQSKVGLALGCDSLELKFLNRLFGYSKCGSRACPPWKCQDDSAVIHGYCCKCPGSHYDNVPVPCYPDLKCPVSSNSLCSDYNFMMECCCSGP
ncbi:hypothetical protein V9T40_011501 [Parthenolecanium corni]|uniref:Uncharacterized protein n=1 Tax=Parthenolecanium corni TaxID=536013 RepID=A0AAN9T7Z5_9HEMI